MLLVQYVRAGKECKKDETQANAVEIKMDKRDKRLAKRIKGKENRKEEKKKPKEKE